MIGTIIERVYDKRFADKSSAGQRSDWNEIIINDRVDQLWCISGIVVTS